MFDILYLTRNFNLLNALNIFNLNLFNAVESKSSTQYNEYTVSVGILQTSTLVY